MMKNAQAETAGIHRPNRWVQSARAIVAAAPLMLALVVPATASADVTTQPRVTGINVTYGSTPITEGGRKVDAVLDGDTLTGTVTIEKPAPAGGLQVAVSQNAQSAQSTLTPPAYVTVPEGQNYVSFPLNVHANAVDYRILRAQIGDSTANSAATGLVMAPRWKLTLRNGSGTPGRGPIPGNYEEIPISIGTTLAPLGSTITLKSDTPGVKVWPQLQLAPWLPGGLFPVTVDSSVPLYTEAHITATWLGQSVTNTFYIHG